MYPCIDCYLHLSSTNSSKKLNDLTHSLNIPSSMCMNQAVRSGQWERKTQHLLPVWRAPVFKTAKKTHHPNFMTWTDAEETTMMKRNRKRLVPCTWTPVPLFNGLFHQEYESINFSTNIFLFIPSQFLIRKRETITIELTMEELVHFCSSKLQCVF